MEYELIIVSIISILGAVIILSFNQRFWEKKWDLKYKFEKYKIQQKRKGAAVPKSPQPTSALSNIASLIPILQNLTPEQIEMFQTFLGGEGEEVEPTGVDGIIDFAAKNPELVQNFLEGLGTKISTSKEPPKKEGY